MPERESKRARARARERKRERERKKETDKDKDTEQEQEQEQEKEKEKEKLVFSRTYFLHNEFYCSPLKASVEHEDVDLAISLETIVEKHWNALK